MMHARRNNKCELNYKLTEIMINYVDLLTDVIFDGYALDTRSASHALIWSY